MLAEQKAGGYSTKYRFTGKEVDEETGLYYFGARYYDPRISLWYGVDPMAEKHPNYNPFAYTANNPVRFIDPDGRDWYEDENCNRRFDEKLTKDNQKDFLKDGQRYLGATHSEKTSNGRGTNNYRKDGSVLFGSQQDAVSHMTSITENTGKEQFGFISGDKVLVTPDNVNDGGNSRPWKAGYKIGDGEFKDPITRLDQKFDATVHTHPRDNYYPNSGNAPSGDDMKTLKDHYPSRLGFTIGLGNRKIYKYYIDGNGNDRAQNTGVTIDNFKKFPKR